jgi:RNA polymerase subunit RPABC4/transcription elongation factor Spt4
MKKKTCLVCHAKLDADETTFPFCGESSWGKTVIVAVPEPVEAEAPRPSKRPRVKVVEE